MSSRKFRPTSHYYQIPPFIQFSLQSIQNPATQLNPPFQPKNPSVLSTNLIKSYFENGLFRQARTLFDEMPERDVVAWTAMIAGNASCNRNSDAWMMFNEMRRVCNGAPNEYTVSSALKACKGMKSLACGALVHGLALRHGVLGSIYVDNALLDMYATCCVDMEDASAVFDDIHEKNSVSWTTLITGYTHRGHGYAGLRVFRQMCLEEVEASPFSYSIAIRACASVGSSTCGKQIHATVIKHGLDFNTPVMNSILDMYCRCSCLCEADRCFHGMTEKDLTTWNTLIGGYEKSDPIESLYIFTQMEYKGFSPNCFTFTSIIAACANLAVLRCGQQVHGGILRRGLERNYPLANCLLDMYAKCGSIMDSRRLFSEMSSKDLVSWTSMMIGYGSHGYGKEAVQVFNEMVSCGIKPDLIVFMAVLSACSHSGLVNEGLSYFKSMTCYYNIRPNQEIYGCVVGLLGRAGRVKEAYELIESMPFKPDESVWGAFLGACKAHGHLNLGKLGAQKVLELKPKTSGTYVMLSSIYAAEGEWGDVAKMRKLIRRMRNKKETGTSWVEVRNQVYSFSVGCKVGSYIDKVYEILGVLVQDIREAGCFSDAESSIDDLDNGLSVTEDDVQDSPSTPL